MSSSSYMPSSDDSGDSQSSVSCLFGHSASSRLKSRIEQHQAALNSMANKTVQQYYESGGPLDSQTTETQWVNALYQSKIITPPRRVTVLRSSPQRSRRSITLSDNHTAVHGGPMSDVFNISHQDDHEQGDITLVEDMGSDIGTKAPLIEPVKWTLTLAETAEDDIPIASSPPPVLALSTIQTFEEYNELVGALGEAQLPPGWSDAPESPVVRADVHVTRSRVIAKLSRVRTIT
ncbi:hypothetical protein IW262DRAFT_1454407 [Armillaria fumosa]|nr:hypothetical protein IW262DRAFT_1454407 [Armillaria fumosa]